MKFQSLLLVVLFACCAQVSYGQDATAPPADQLRYTLSEPPEPLVILQADGKSIILDPDRHDMPEMESLVDVQWVKSIEMLSGEDAVSKYGSKARNGVLIIEFKPNYILPARFPASLKDGE